MEGFDHRNNLRLNFMFDILLLPSGLVGRNMDTPASEPKFGGFFAYQTQRNIYGDHGGKAKTIGEIQAFEPFVVLDKVKMQYCTSCKVLSSEGIVGWIYVGEDAWLHAVRKI
jgi:hypothetical protein